MWVVHLRDRKDLSNLAVFGTVDEIKIKKVPYKLSNVYFCGNEFYPLDPPYEGPKRIIVVFEYGHCTIAEYNNSIRIINQIKDYIPKKHRQGGQSAPRFDRLLKEAQHCFDKKVKEYLYTLTYDKLYVGGPGLSPKIWTNKHIASADRVVGCQYNEMSGIREVLHKIKTFK